MADHWFQSTGRFGLLKVIAPSFFDGFSRERWQTLIEHLKSNVMEKVSDNLLLFSHNLQADGAQFFWDTLYINLFSLTNFVELVTFLPTTALLHKEVNILNSTLCLL